MATVKQLDSGALEVQEPLWLTADRDKVVAAGSEDAAFLLAAPGAQIDQETAERYGLKITKR